MLQKTFCAALIFSSALSIFYDRHVRAETEPSYEFQPRLQRTHPNPLAGKQLRYLIGTDSPGIGSESEVTAVSYDTPEPVKRGLSIAYCNLFDEKNTREYSPYLNSSDTAEGYGEGQIDPRGTGRQRNLRKQFEHRKVAGFEFVELDNADAYGVQDIIAAIDLAASYGLKVIAKNPALLKAGALKYVAHPGIYGVIVEKDAGTPEQMDTLRRESGKASLLVWFVSHGRGRNWAMQTANSARRFQNMGVTHSNIGEYGDATDVLLPRVAAR